MRSSNDSFNSLLYYFLLIYYTITNNEKSNRQQQCNSTLYLFYNSVVNNKDNNPLKMLDITDAIQFIKETMKHYLIQQPSSLYVSILNLNVGCYSEQELNISMHHLQQKMLQYSLLCLSAVLLMTIDQQKISHTSFSCSNIDTDMIFPFMLLTQCQEILVAIDVCLLRLLDISISDEYNVIQVTKFMMIELQRSILQFSNAYSYFNLNNTKVNQQPWSGFLSSSITTMKDISYNELQNVEALQIDIVYQDQSVHWNQNIDHALIVTLEKIHMLFITQLKI